MAQTFHSTNGIIFLVELSKNACSRLHATLVGLTPWVALKIHSGVAGVSIGGSMRAAAKIWWMTAMIFNEIARRWWKVPGFFVYLQKKTMTHEELKEYLKETYGGYAMFEPE